jgi:hypothetical protein
LGAGRSGADPVRCRSSQAPSCRSSVGWVAGVQAGARWMAGLGRTELAREPPARTTFFHATNGKG